MCFEIEEKYVSMNQWRSNTHHHVVAVGQRITKWDYREISERAQAEWAADNSCWSCKSELER